jgi:hypothetical protein
MLLCLSNDYTIYIIKICFLKDFYMFSCLYIIRWESLITYAKVTMQYNGNIYTGDCYRRSID